MITAKVLRVAAGVLIGAVGGYLWYRLVGCSTGACPLTSNPVVCTLYGALIGLLAVGGF